MVGWACESKCLCHRRGERGWQDHLRSRISAGVRGLQEFHQRRLNRTGSFAFFARIPVFSGGSFDAGRNQQLYRARRGFRFRDDAGGPESFGFNSAHEGARLLRSLLLLVVAACRTYTCQNSKAGSGRRSRRPGSCCSPPLHSLDPKLPCSLSKPSGLLGFV